MNTKLLYALIVVVLILAGVVYGVTQKRSSAPQAVTVNIGTATDEEAGADEEALEEVEETFSEEQKTPHFVAATPAHETYLAGVPINVVIDTDFDLADNSAMTITKNGKEYGTGATTVDNNKLAMRRSMDPAAPDGMYTVAYKACWPDRSCHDGKLQFAIDRSFADAFEDLRGKENVTVTLEDLAIRPADIHVSKGTTVRWQNDDQVPHYVNTDSHPTHTYYPALNSKELQTADSFTLTFDTPGIYPYHCSAHPDEMIGTVLVE